MNQDASENTLSEDDFLLSLLRQQSPSSESIDERSLLTLARLHGVIPQLHKTPLTEHLLGETNRQTLHQQYQQILQANLLLTAHLITVSTALEAHGFNYIVIKGPALSQALYNDISMRQFSDIDIFINEKDILEIAQLLSRLEYEPVLPLSLLTRKQFLALDNDFSFRHKKTNALLELHWKLFPVRHKMPLSFTELHSHSQKLSMQGREITVLSEEDNLLYLSLHGAKHIFERYEWVYDLHSLIQKNPELNLISVYETAREKSIEVPFLLGIFLSKTLFGTPIPKELEKAKKPQIDELMTTVLNYYSKGFVHWDESEKKRARFLFLSQLFQEQEAKTLWLFKSLFKTTPVDVITFNLPDGLAFLYPILRPFRLAYKHLFSKKPQYV